MLKITRFGMFSPVKKASNVVKNVEDLDVRKARVKAKMDKCLEAFRRGNMQALKEYKNLEQVYAIMR